MLNFCSKHNISSDIEVTPVQNVYKAYDGPVILGSMHEYLTVYATNQSYGQCTECKKRTPHIWTKCNYCYSCHLKIERIEKDAQANALIKYY
ncbi:MAG: hypothetical protein WAK17_04960 [Candidatus Nitrosopolaris sp.]|jgi:hypothetical protein